MTVMKPSDPLEIRKEVNNTEYFCMVLCEGIVKGAPIMYNKMHKKLGYQIQDNPDDKKARGVFNMFYNVSLADAHHMYTQDMRDLMSGSL
jgi:hypothetical protein